MSNEWVRRAIDLLFGQPEVTYRDPRTGRQHTSQVQGGTLIGPAGALGSGAGALARGGSTALRGPIRQLPPQGALPRGSQAVTRGRQPSGPGTSVNSKPTVVRTMREGSGQRAIGAGGGRSNLPVVRSTTNRPGFTPRTGGSGGVGIGRQGMGNAGKLGLAGAAGLGVAGLISDRRGAPASGADSPMARQSESFRNQGLNPGIASSMGALVDGLVGGGRGGAAPAMGDLPDPYLDFLNSQLGSLTDSYDAKIAAIAGLDPIYRDQAREAQGRIGDFFGYAGDVARAGIPVTQEIYDTGIGNVNNVYDDLGSRLAGLPGQLTDIATDAAGGAVSGSVAERVSSASAPFMAAGETSRANAVANLTQHSTAGQSYLNNLASATAGEASMHQSAVESALNQQLQLVAHRQAELEGSKQRALMEISADIAGHSSERMAQQALAAALGLDHLPGGVDPMQYLRGQQMIHGMQPDPGDPIRDMKAQVDLERAMLNLAQSENPNFHRDQVLSNISVPAQQAFDNLLRGVESQWETTPGMADDPRQRANMLLQALDQYVAEGRLDSSMSRSGLSGGQQNIEKEVRDAIRRIYQQ